MSRGCVAIAIAVAGQGCLPAPQIDRQSTATTHAISSTQLSTTQPAVRDRRPNDLWKAENARPRSTTNSTTNPVKRIAIVEFTIEFVTIRSRTPFDSQLAVKIPPWDPIGGALEVIGISRARTPFQPDDRIALTTNLFIQFTKHLHDLGFIVIPQSDIHSLPAYDSLTKGHPDNASADSSPLDYARLLATDVGVINASTQQPAHGMRLLDRDMSDEDRRKAEALLLAETDADAAIALHLLVGCYNGRAAIEERSRLVILHADTSETTLTSQRSLLSDKKVRTPGHFMPVVGMVEPVKMDVFDREIGELFGPYLEPALDAGLGD